MVSNLEEEKKTTSVSSRSEERRGGRERNKNELRRLSSVANPLEGVHHLVPRSRTDILEDDDHRPCPHDPPEHLKNRKDGERNASARESSRRGLDEGIDRETHTHPCPPRFSLVIDLLLRLVEVGEIDAGGTGDEDGVVVDGDRDLGPVGVVSGEVSEFGDVGEEDGCRERDKEEEVSMESGGRERGGDSRGAKFRSM